MDTETVMLICASLCVGLVLLREIYLFYVKKCKKLVECWFCQHKTKVKFKDRNSWTCSECEQYNGFTEDGDYNRVIPAQRDERLNSSTGKGGRGEWKSGSKLCDSCNRNQTFKIRQLASFVPFDEKNYHIEIEHYRKQLELSYRLCHSCEDLLATVLNNQKKNFLGAQNIMRNAIEKIESEGRKSLYLTLVLSFVVSGTAVIGLLFSPPPEEEVTPRGIIEEKLEELLQKAGLTGVTWWVEYPGGVTGCVVLSCLLLETIQCLTRKELSCFLNWSSWVVLLLLTHYPSGYSHLISYLQVLTGLCSMLVTGLTLWRRRTKRIELKKAKERSPERPLKPRPMSHSAPQAVPVRIRPSVDLKKKDISMSEVTKTPVLGNKDFESDFGIGRLSLGPQVRVKRRPPLTKNLVSPGKLKLGGERLRSSGSEGSSGFEGSTGCSSLSPPPSPSPRLLDFDYSSAGSPQFYQSPPYPFYQLPSPEFYQFGASHHHYQRVFLAHSCCSHSSLPPPPQTPVVSHSFDPWSLLYLIPLFLLVLSNLALLWTLYLKEVGRPLVSV